MNNSSWNSSDEAVVDSGGDIGLICSDTECIAEVGEGVFNDGSDGMV